MALDFVAGRIGCKIKVIQIIDSKSSGKILNTCLMTINEITILAMLMTIRNQWTYSMTSPSFSNDVITIFFSVYMGNGHIIV